MRTSGDLTWNTSSFFHKRAGKVRSLVTNPYHQACQSMFQLHLLQLHFWLLVSATAIHTSFNHRGLLNYISLLYLVHVNDCLITLHVVYTSLWLSYPQCNTMTSFSNSEQWYKALWSSWISIFFNYALDFISFVKFSFTRAPGTTPWCRWYLKIKSKRHFSEANITALDTDKSAQQMHWSFNANKISHQNHGANI